MFSIILSTTDESVKIKHEKYTVVINIILTWTWMVCIEAVAVDVGIHVHALFVY